MAAHSVIPQCDYWDTPTGYQPSALAPRAHDAYMRGNSSHEDDITTRPRGNRAHEDRDPYWEQDGYRERNSPRYGPPSAHHTYEREMPDRRHQEETFSRAPAHNAHNSYRRGSPEYSPAHVYRERDDYRRHSPAPVYQDRDEFGREMGSRRDSYEPSPYGNYDHVPATQAPTHHSRRSPEMQRSRKPRGGDFLAQPGNANSVPIGRRGVHAAGDPPPKRGREDASPARLGGGRDDYPSRNIDTQQSHGRHQVDQPSHRMDLPDERASRGDYPGYDQHSRPPAVPASFKPLPLSDIPPNIHPSRLAAIPTHGGGGRQIANMRAPRKQAENIAQSIEPSETRGPAFGSSSNAIPLGPGKKMRI